MMGDLQEDELCYPELLNFSCRRVPRPHTEVIYLYGLLSSIAFLTVVLNLLVIISISHFKQLHTPTNLLLLSLAVSDLLVGLLVMPVEMLRMVGNCWLLGNIMCALTTVLTYTFISASVGNMVLISIDRYIAICYPLQYSNQITLRRVELCVCLCWACALLYNGLIMKENYKQPDKYKTCIGECHVVINYVSGRVDLCVTFIGPCFIIVILYMRVFITAVSQARAIQTHVRVFAVGKAKTTAKKSERKAARTLGVLILVFLVTFCPYFCLSLGGQDISNIAFFYTFVAWFAYFNSCLNPLIYALFYPWFRKAVKCIVTLKILEQCSSLANIL